MLQGLPYREVSVIHDWADRATSRASSLCSFRLIVHAFRVFNV
jgi:hypothetical protein